MDTRPSNTRGEPKKNTAQHKPSRRTPTLTPLPPLPQALPRAAPRAVRVASARVDAASSPYTKKEEVREEREGGSLVEGRRVEVKGNMKFLHPSTLPAIHPPHPQGNRASLEYRMFMEAKGLWRVASLFGGWW